jgi:hypothetical protein
MQTANYMACLVGFLIFVPGPSSNLKHSRFQALGTPMGCLGVQEAPAGTKLAYIEFKILFQNEKKNSMSCRITTLLVQNGTIDKVKYGSLTS